MAIDYAQKVLLSSIVETNELINELISQDQINTAEAVWDNVQQTKVDRFQNGNFRLDTGTASDTGGSE